MAFEEVPGLKGKVYVPEKRTEDRRKHQCADCYSCQLCRDDRCNLCLDKRSCPEKKIYGRNREKKAMRKPDSSARDSRGPDVKTGRPDGSKLS